MKTILMMAQACQHYLSYSRIKIDSIYSKNPFSSGKILNMHIDTFSSLLNDNAFEQFCEKEKIDPLYFVNINNPLSANFNFRLMQALVIKGIISKDEQIKKYSQNAIKIINNSPFGNVYDNSAGVDRILLFFQFSEQYEDNHEYKIFDYYQGREILCGFRPREHVDLNLYNGPFLKGVFCKFLHCCFEEIGGGKDIISEKISCIHKGDAYCSYRYTNSKVEVC